ncbi:hypothetical protein [Kocuria sp.]|uniref:hypothetical protein n=1 Tax=Kocuria sp. TaxID=1871328 RepID=UPI0026DF4410|nr:hypothetical protein [Kocuria sp.]MDO5619269.1 hypothetical protein [Kocuria sp.]
MGVRRGSLEPDPDPGHGVRERNGKRLAIHRFLTRYPNATADLAALYGVNGLAAVTGSDDDVELTLTLIDRLPNDVNSHYRAIDKLGDHTHIGRSRDTMMLESVSDQIQALHNMVAVKGSKKRPRKIKPVERPSSRHTPLSLDDVDSSFFS